MKKRILIIALFFICIGCDKDEYFGPIYKGQNSDIMIDSVNKMIIGCEGNFQYSNASISIVDLDNEVVSNNVYRSINEKAIGDVLQSFTAKGDSLLVVLNNSGTVKLLDKNTIKEIESFDGFVSPRYAAFLDDQNILITDIYAKKLIRFNLISKSITGSINTSGWQEQIIIKNDIAVISNLTQNQLDIIDLASFSLIDSVSLSFKPSYIESINDDQIAVAGENIDTAGLFQVSVFNWSLELFSSRKFGGVVAGFDCEADDCYYADSKFVYKFEPNSGLSAKLFEHRNLTPYALHYNSIRGLIVTCDAKDYISNGEVQVFNMNGVLLKNYTVGIIPQTVSFSL